MAFAGMFILTIIFLIVGFGFISLIIGIILALRWKAKRTSGKKVGTAHKFFTIGCSISGFVCFVIPMVALVIGMGVSAAKKKAELSKFDTKIEIENSSDFTGGFEIDGISYVPADFLHSVGDSNQRFCAFVYSNGDFESCYVFESESGYDVLYVEHYSGTYVREDEYDEIFSYYTEEAPFVVTVHINDGGDIAFEADDFDRNILCALKDRYDSDMDFECDTPGIDFSFYIQGSTSDGAYGISVNFDVVDGQIILPHITGGGHMRGHTIDDEYSEYLISVIEDYVEYDFAD